MPSTGMPSAIFASICARLGNSCLHLAGALPHGVGLSSSSRLGGSSARRDRVRAASAGRRPRTARICSTSSPKNSMRSGCSVGRREDVEDAAAHRELAAPGDHVDPGVGEVDEPGGQLGEVVSAAAGRRGRSGSRSVRLSGERLERGPHAGDDDDRMLRVGLSSRARRRSAVDALADRLGARAEALVRQRLPGRELDDLGGRDDRGQRIPQRLGLARGRDDRQQRLRAAACASSRLASSGARSPSTREKSALWLAKSRACGERLGARKPGD